MWSRTSVLAALPVAVVAVVAGWISYSHIESLALRTGQSLTDARLLPVSVDGLIVAGSIIVLARGGGLGWLGIGPGAFATLYANVMSGLPHGPLGAAVASWPAVGFLLAVAMLERFAVAAASIGDEDDEDDWDGEDDDAPVAPAVGQPAGQPAPDAPDTTPARQGTSGADLEARALAVLARQPDVTGAELGRAIGASPRTGQRLLARLSGHHPHDTENPSERN